LFISSSSNIIKLHDIFFNLASSFFSYCFKSSLYIIHFPKQKLLSTFEYYYHLYIRFILKEQKVISVYLKMAIMTNKNVFVLLHIFIGYFFVNKNQKMFCAFLI
jgi:hypothetical protein